MSLSTSPVFLSEELDGEDLLNDIPATDLISKQSSPCMFDILNPDNTTHSLHASLLEDIDLDLQCEEDGVDTGPGTDFDNILDQSLPVAYAVNQTGRPMTDMIKMIKRDKTMMPVAIKGVRGTEQASKPLALRYPSDSIEMKMSFPVLDIASDPVKFQSPISFSGILCHLCNVHFSSYEALLAHNKDKHVYKKEILLHECSLCGERFKSKKSLIRHSAVHDKKRERKLKTKKLSKILDSHPCNSCSYVGKTAALLRAHKSAKHDPHRKVYRCDICSFSCFHERSLTLHIARHNEDPKFACDQCGKLFLSMGILKRHAHTHSKARPYLCSVVGCLKSFTIKSRLTDHMRQVHRKKHNSASDKHFQVCNTEEDNSGVDNKYSTHSKDCLINELVESHTVNNDTIITTQKPDLSSCDICVYDIVLFNDQNEQSHRKSSRPTSMLKTEHTNYSQTLTSKVTSEVSSTCVPGRPLHNATIGLEKRKFKCSWDGCNKAFRDNYNLRVHYCTHTGEMERTCPFCRYRCVQKSAMNAHLKTHTNPKKVMSVTKVASH